MDEPVQSLVSGAFVIAVRPQRVRLGMLLAAAVYDDAPVCPQAVNANMRFMDMAAASDCLTDYGSLAINVLPSRPSEVNSAKLSS